MRTRARGNQALNRLRLPSEKDLLSALESSEALPGRILAVHLSGTGGVVLELSALGETLESLTALAASLGGDLAPLGRLERGALYPAGRDSPSMSIEAYLEALPLVPGPPPEGAHWREEHVALIRADSEAYHRALSLLLKFGFDPDSGLMEAAALSGSPGYLVRFRGLRSVYPLLEWEGRPDISLFVPLAEGSRLYLAKGLRHPLRRLEDYHRGLAEVTLAPSRGPWLRLEGVRFAPISRAIQVKAGIHEEPLRLSGKDFPPDDRLEVRLELVKVEGREERRPRSARLEDRIQRLERFRDRTNARLSELYGLLDPGRDGGGGRVIYCFAEARAQALHSFVAGHPFSMVKEFRYFPAYYRVGESEGGVLHLLEPTRDAVLPPLVAVDAEVYRPDGNFDRLGLPVYVPAGEKLWPVVHFSAEDAPVLREALFGPESSDEKLCLLRRPRKGKGILKLVLDRKDFLPLAEAVRFLNRTVQAATVEALRRSADEEGCKEEPALGQEVRARLAEAREALRREIESELQALRGESEGLLQKLEEDRRALLASEERRRQSAALYRDLLEIEEKDFASLEEILSALREAILRRFAEPLPRREALLAALQALQAELEEALSGTLGKIEKEAAALGQRRQEVEDRLDRLAEDISRALALEPSGTARTALERASEALDRLREKQGA